jgi:protease PrsW
MPALSLLPGFLPVILFLGGLLMMDTFKLIPRRLVLRSIAAGSAAAVLAFLWNAWAMESFRLTRPEMTRIYGPTAEELLKAALVVYLVGKARVGFMVDAGIHGFAVGTGFALVENAYYATVLGDTSVWLWVVRGLGTAVMHGSTTAIVGILAKYFADRVQARRVLLFLPGLVLAILLHAGFNSLGRWPLLATFASLFFMPLVLIFVFEASERATRDWLGRGFDHDIEILELIESGGIRQTPTGQYLETLRSRFPGPVLADMLCLLQVHLELAARAKGILIAREAGIEIPTGDDTRANLGELRYLERAIGPTGRLAITPLLRTSSRDLWQIYMLRERR